MTQHCTKHPWESSDNICRECRYAHCSECLVYVHGPDREPLCVNCALAISGVRKSRRNRPRLSLFAAWREKRRNTTLPDEPDTREEQRQRAAHELSSWAHLDADVWDVDERESRSA